MSDVTVGIRTTDIIAALDKLRPIEDRAYELMQKLRRRGPTGDDPAGWYTVQGCWHFRDHELQIEANVTGCECRIRYNYGKSFEDVSGPTPLHAVLLASQIILARKNATAPSSELAKRVAMVKVVMIVDGHPRTLEFLRDEQIAELLANDRETLGSFLRGIVQEASGG